MAWGGMGWEWDDIEPDRIKGGALDALHTTTFWKCGREASRAHTIPAHGNT